MRLSALIARRFLFSPKSHSVVNITSRVSMVAVGVPVAAMVILMSVFAGFDGLIRRMYADFDSPLLVRPAEGKVFEISSLDVEAVRGLEGVEAVSVVLEDNALVEYRARQMMVSVRGVDESYNEVVPIEGMTFAADEAPELPWREEKQGVVVGQGVAYELGVRLGFREELGFFAARRGSWSALLPVSAFSHKAAAPTAIFSLDADTDGSYVFVPLEFARELFDYRGRASALAVKAPENLRGEVQKAVGGEFEVLTRVEQRPGMYRVMVVEKWGVFFIALVVLVIASFSIVGSLVMLVIDKRQGIATLRAMGATKGLVRDVFVRQGLMIGALGAVGGLVLGVLVCGVQQIFGVVPMPGGTFLIDSYPVSMRPLDLAVVCGSFVAVIWSMSWFTVRVSIKDA